jgi:hypothetical protein
MLAQDFAQPGASLTGVLTHSSHEYTIRGSEWRWGNMVTALLVPQRSLMLGLPMAIVSLTLLWRDLSNSSVRRSSALADGSAPTNNRRIVAGGVIAGMLPLVHAHTFAVIVGTAGCLALLHGRIRRWIPFFVISIAAGVAQILWISSGSPIQQQRILEWSFGWDHGSENVALFWLKNTGLTIPLLALAMVWRGKQAPVPRRLLMFYLPFTLCWLVPNLVRLAPWIWDNIKVLVYWQVASAPLIALLLVRFWRHGPGLRVVAVLLTITLTLAGALDIWRVLVRATELQVFSREGMAFAEQVRSAVAPKSVIVHAPTYNHPVFLSGRRSLMGYPGHVWSHGIAYAEREAEIRKIYSGGPESEAIILRRGLEYLVVGPLERTELAVNELFVSRHPKVVQAGEYALFRLAPEHPQIR